MNDPGAAAAALRGLGGVGDGPGAQRAEESAGRAALGAIRRRRAPGWRRWPALLLGLAALLAIAVYVAGRARPLEVTLGSVVMAYPTQALALLNATGHVVPQTRASVSSKGTGRLEWLGVQEGQQVAVNQVIARLESRDVAAQRDQAAAGVELARANLVQGEAERDNAAVELRRAQELAATHFISSSALDSAQARYNKASASIAALQAQIGVASASLHAAQVGVDQTLIRAPFAGVVLTKNANVGDILTPFSNAAGTTGAVVTMADMASLEVEADVSESSIARISVGQPAEIQLDAFPELRLLGTVSRIVPDVDRSRATLLVKVRFDQPDPRVLPDMSARIAFLSRAPRADERQPVTALRPEAVVKRDGRDGRDAVFVVQAAGGGVADGASSANAANAPIAADPAAPPPDAGKAVLTAVRLGPKIGDLIQVDGVAAGTRVVIDPPPDLADGRSVAAARK